VRRVSDGQAADAAIQLYEVALRQLLGELGVLELCRIQPAADRLFQRLQRLQGDVFRQTERGGDDFVPKRRAENLVGRVEVGGHAREQYGRSQSGKLFVEHVQPLFPDIVIRDFIDRDVELEQFEA